MKKTLKQKTVQPMAAPSFAVFHLYLGVLLILLIGEPLTNQNERRLQRRRWHDMARDDFERSYLWLWFRR